mgnify:CR=1 FL=1
MPEYRNATASLKENTAYVNEILPVQESFDIVQRNMMIGGREAAFSLWMDLRKMNQC